MSAADSRVLGGISVKDDERLELKKKTEKKEKRKSKDLADEDVFAGGG